MADLIKIIDEKTGLCEKALFPENAEYFLNNGYQWGECEKGFDGRLYVSGMAPEKPVDLKKQDVRKVRNTLLIETDKFVLPDYPEGKEKEKAPAYRAYLRNYPQSSDDWFESIPISFDEWLKNE